MEGTKYDNGKPRMDLIPPELLMEVSKILTFGADKYAERNWEKGMDWGRVYGALQRHLWAWWSGDSKDAETGESHLAHAACCIAFLLTYEQRGIGKDTRSTNEMGESNIGRVRGLCPPSIWCCDRPTDSEGASKAGDDKASSSDLYEAGIHFEHTYKEGGSNVPVRLQGLQE